MVTMDDGTAFTIGAGWALPPGYPHFSTATIEFHGTEGALLIDDSHRDIVLSTMGKGMVLPLSTMPGESVGHVYQGPLQAETIHFIEAVALQRRGRVSIAMDEKNGRADRVRLVERRSAAEHLLKLGIVASSRLPSKVGFDGGKLQAVPGTRLGPREPVLEVGDRIVGNHRAD